MLQSSFFDLVISYLKTLALYPKMSVKCRVPNKCLVSNKRRGSEAHVLINAESQLNAQLNSVVFQQYRVVRIPAIH